MSKKSKIELLKNREIDYQKWDSCITNSLNPLIYAESWYLNIVSPGWQALIYGDYDAMLPLPVTKKAFFNFIVQPPFTQQLGIFSKERLSYKEFINIEKKIPYINCIMSYNHMSAPVHQKYYKRTNMVVNLNKGVDALKSEYSKNCKRNVKKASAFNQSVIVEDRNERFITFIKQEFPINLSKKELNILNNIAINSLDKKRSKIIYVQNSKEEILAAALFLFSNKRITFIAGCSSAEGIKQKSMFLLIDYIISKYSGEEILLDFEGSDNYGTARFYKGFGAIIEEYYCVKNRFFEYGMQLRQHR
ncbi:hypothetical protein QA597_11670 [Marinilabiliaceae bacterium ANBcel2]|nr:hypothetical protein [Marinilabiliaceae bacterium ANBcel2]